MGKDGWGGIALLWAMMLFALLGLAHRVSEAVPSVTQFEACRAAGQFTTPECRAWGP